MRDRALDSLAGRHFDLIVVGAGINGAGIARDAGMRGLSVLLLDKGDLSAGTTQWSTRLVHGGLRYLEYAEIGLVRESLHERERLLHVAGHLVRPLPMVIPIYESDRRGPRLIRLGMAAYDALSLRKSLDHHHVLSVEDLLEREPGLVPDGLKGGALYYDAQVEFPERLVVENALSARDQGALVLTYASVERILVEENVARGVEVRDRLGGGTHTARGEVVVNAAGPWVDEVLGRVPRTARRRIGGTKGSHVVVAPFPGAPRSALYLEAGEDARPYFVVPWNGLYLIGTTDSRYDGDLDHVAPTAEEIDYLLRETNRVLPGAGLDSTSVLYAYAGVRPLPYVENGAAGAITRRHMIHDHAPDLAAGLVSIVGGKLTTYRSLAEEAVDLVFERLGRRSPGSHTAKVPLPGGSAGPFEGFAATFKATSGLEEETAERLLRIYGVRATGVAAIAEGDAALREPLEGAPDSLAAEVVHAVRHEGAQTLADVLLRRTMIGLGPTAGIGPDRAAARVAESHLGWDEGRATREVEDFRRYMRRYRPRGLVEA